MMTKEEMRSRTPVFTPVEVRVLLTLLVILIAAVLLLISIRHRNLRRRHPQDLGMNHF